MRSTAIDKTLIFENAISWIVVMGMLVYGASKVIQFKGADMVDMHISEMSNMQLMWAFYGRSTGFAITLGILEITGGLLLFFRKTRILGCLFTSTILVNIILQDIFYNVTIGALRNAIIYQCIILIILYLHKEKLIKAFKELWNGNATFALSKNYLIHIVLALILFMLLRLAEFYIIKLIVLFL